jgi:hypothetical protein
MVTALAELRAVAGRSRQWPVDSPMHRVAVRHERALIRRVQALAGGYVPPVVDALPPSTGPAFLGMYPC